MQRASTDRDVEEPAVTQIGCRIGSLDAYLPAMREWRDARGRRYGYADTTCYGKHRAQRGDHGSVPDGATKVHGGLHVSKRTCRRTFEILGAE
jgi:hypothetical protein